MARRTSTAWLVMEKPATRASPEEGGNSVVSILIVVVLPAPLEPSKPKTSPALTERVIESTATNAPKRRVSILISRIIALIGLSIDEELPSLFAVPSGRQNGLERGLQSGHRSFCLPIQPPR